MSGLDGTGLTIELVPDIRAGIDDDFRAEFGASLPMGDKTVLGHWSAVVSERIGLAWERLEQVNSSQDPDKAVDSGLDALCALTGTLRETPLSSTVIETLCGDPGTLVSLGWLVNTASTQLPFKSAADVTLAALAAWTPTSSYTVGNRVTNSSRCYQCITAGTSAGSGGPTTTALDITDGTVHWAYIGEGTAAGDVEVLSVTKDAIVAVARDLTSIQTPVSGLRSATNLLDAQLGRGTQSNQSLRLLREAELSGNGGSTGDAIRAALLKVTAVTAATVIKNVTDVTDGDGRPPHTFECMVLGGADQDVVDTIAEELPVGIATYGTSSGSHTDSQGTTETINFSRPTSVPVYADVTLTYDATQYPVDGDAEVKSAIATNGQENYVIGQDVHQSAVGAQAFQVRGIEGVSQVLIYTDVIGTPVAWAGTTGYSATVGARSVVTNDGGRTYICITTGTSAGSGGPTGTGTNITDGTVHWRFLGNPIVIDNRSIPTFDTTRINVHSSAATP